MYKCLRTLIKTTLRPIYTSSSDPLETGLEPTVYYSLDNPSDWMQCS